MIRVPGERDQVNIAKVYKAGQSHILRFWDKLGYESRKKLLAQIDTIDFQLLTRLVKGLGADAPKRTAVELKPAPVIRLPQTPREHARRREAIEEGEKAIRAGAVALLAVAGGQASRLGLNRPKGEFPIGPISDKSLFALFAEKILALRKRYGARLSWYIMTSDATDAHTREFFDKHNYFGMPRASVVFFRQGMFPAVDRRGKMILSATDEIFMSPNGHGGVLPALHESGALERMEQEGSDLLFYFQVDNPLAVIADPAFIGYHILEGAQASCKAVRKRKPQERVGVFASVEDKTVIVEYSEMTQEEQELRDAAGELVYGAGNIAIHVFSAAFLKKVISSEHPLPYHTSFRKVPYTDKSGRLVHPRKPNAYKFETFVFDALSISEKTVVMEVSRKDEFAPVKNIVGDDTPENAVQALTNMYGRWLAGCGMDVPLDGQGNVEGTIEISPLYALDPEELKQNVKLDTEFTGQLYLQP